MLLQSMKILIVVPWIRDENSNSTNTLKKVIYSDEVGKL